MQGFGADRTFSAAEWRVLLVAACGVLIVGVGLGVLVGRMTAPVPEVPPVSARIIPDVPPATVTPAATGDDDGDDTPIPPSPKAPASSPAPAAIVPPSAPVAAKPVAALPPQAERTPVPVALTPRAEHQRAKVKPAAGQPAPKRAKAKPALDAAAPIHGPRWIVQLGAFQSSDHANLLVNTLAAHGQPARVNFTRDAAGQGWFYVQTQAYRSASAAKSAAKDLAAQEHLPTYLVKLPADAG